MKATKPNKPRKDFPLFAHSSGQWARKINGKFYYFGVWADPQGAYKRYMADRDYLYADRIPPSRQTTVAALLDKFLGGKKSLLDTGDIAEETFKEYKATCDVVAAAFGKNREVETLTTADFDMLRGALAKGKCRCTGTYRLDSLRTKLPAGEYQAVRDAIRDGKSVYKSSLGTISVADAEAFSAAKETGYKWQAIKGLQLSLTRKICQCPDRLGPVSLKRRLTVARMIFGYANDEMELNLRYKKPLQAPSKVKLRRDKRERGKRLYQATEIRQLVAAADPYMRAMILLGINCGFGPRDCCTFPVDAVDLEGGWHDFARPKTEVERRCPLWPETVAALRKVIGKRHVFNGRSWTRWTVASEFAKLCEACGVRNLGHYSLRRTFETVAGAAEVNQAVVDKIMGHARDDMASIYRQKVYDDMLRKCADHVRGWYLGSIELK